MEKIKKGDLVIRTDRSHYEVKQGNTYTVARVFGTSCDLRDVPGSYALRKFERVRPRVVDQDAETDW